MTKHSTQILKNFRVHFLLFALGFFLGPFCDLFHNVTGTSAYKSPQILGLARWVPFLFGSAVFVIGFSQTLVRVFMSDQNRTKACSPIIPLMLFVFQYALSGYLVAPLVVKTMLLVFVSVLCVWMLKSSALSLVLALVTAFGGTGFEILLGQWGEFFYFQKHQNFWGVPLWLPAIYFTASLAVSHLAWSLYFPEKDLSHEC